jgi:hypothetical protein
LNQSKEQYEYQLSKLQSHLYDNAGNQQHGKNLPERIFQLLKKEKSKLEALREKCLNKLK